MRAPHLVAALLLTALLSACGGEDAEPRAGDESDRPLPRSNGLRTLTPTATPAPETEPAAKVLRRWQVKTGLAGTGRWTMAYDVDGVGSHDQSGSFALSPARSLAESRIEREDGVALELTTRSNQRGSWMRFRTGGFDVGRCWIPLDSPALADAFGGASAAAGLPPAVAVIASATRPRYDDVRGTITARTDLYTTLGVLGSGVLTDLGIPADDRHRTSVTIRLVDDQVAGWQIDVDRLLRDAAAAGFSTPKLDPEALTNQRISVSIVMDGAPVRVPDPPARLLRPLLSDEAAFERSLAGCGASTAPRGTPA